jgi:predicted HicB family RNase H-like nuclease
MNLNPYLETIHEQLDAASQAGGEEARELAGRLMAPLDASVRLALQDALTAAAEEITVELAPGSVETRLRGRELRFVVTPPPPVGGPADDEDVMTARVELQRTADGDDGTMSRINLRMPEGLKVRIEAAAGAEDVSVNAWLVRAASARLERREHPRRSGGGAPHGPERYTGWAR